MQRINGRFAAVCLFVVLLQPAILTAAESPSAKPEAIKISRPSGNLNLKIGHPSSIGFYDVPTEMTHERLNKEGWKIESVTFTRTDLNIQALSQGTVQMAVALSIDPLRAVEKGGKIKWLMENTPGEFVMIAKKEIAKCENLTGQRFAIHGETSGTSIAAKRWVQNVCKASPNIIVVPGGENRIIALRNGQIDATLVQLSDWLNLDAQAPGRFHVIVSGGPFNISGSGLWANTDWLEKNREIATAYLAETLKTFRIINGNPQLLEKATLTYVPDTRPESLAPTVRTYRQIGAWPQNGGDSSMLEEAIRFFTEQGELKPGLDAKAIVAGGNLQNALKMIGRVPGSR
jgi:ABC-type nitrate/sulfonate/bicarbonate transport system substrate-binding protein